MDRHIDTCMDQNVDMYICIEIYTHICVYKCTFSYIDTDVHKYIARCYLGLCSLGPMLFGPNAT